MKTVKLSMVGFCGDCKRWLELNPNISGLPVHNTKREDKKGKYSYSGVSASDYRYVIKTKEEASLVVDFIIDDDGGCLVRDRHSMQCFDGEQCHNERLLISKALAMYYKEEN